MFCSLSPRFTAIRRGLLYVGLSLTAIPGGLSAAFLAGSAVLCRFFLEITSIGAPGPMLCSLLAKCWRPWASPIYLVLLLSVVSRLLAQCHPLLLVTLVTGDNGLPAHMSVVVVVLPVLLWGVCPILALALALLVVVVMMCRLCAGNVVVVVISDVTAGFPVLPLLFDVHEAALTTRTQWIWTY